MKTSFQKEEKERRNKQFTTYFNSRLLQTHAGGGFGPPPDQATKRAARLGGSEAPVGQPLPCGVSLHFPHISDKYITSITTNSLSI